MSFQAWSGAARAVNFAARWLDRRLFQRPIILCYHRIVEESIDPWGLSVSPRNLSEHLEALLQHGVKVLPLSELLTNFPNGSHIAAITFDDGYADNLYQAKPILERHGMPATFFLSTGQIGLNEEFWWDELDQVLEMTALPTRIDLMRENNTSFRWQLSEERSSAPNGLDRSWRAWRRAVTPRQDLYCRLHEFFRMRNLRERQNLIESLRKILGWKGTSRAERRTLTWLEVDQLIAGGQMQLGGHTVHHVDLAASPQLVQNIEIRDGKRELEDRVGQPIVEFAYPYGSPDNYTSQTVGLVQNAGFLRAYTTVSRCLRKVDQPFELPRFCVHNWNGDQFAQRLGLG